MGWKTRFRSSCGLQRWLVRVEDRQRDGSGRLSSQNCAGNGEPRQPTRSAVMTVRRSPSSVKTGQKVPDGGIVAIYYRLRGKPATRVEIDRSTLPRVPGLSQRVSSVPRAIRWGLARRQDLENAGFDVGAVAAAGARQGNSRRFETYREVAKVTNRDALPSGARAGNLLVGRRKHINTAFPRSSASAIVCFCRKQIGKSKHERGNRSLNVARRRGPSEQARGIGTVPF